MQFPCYILDSLKKFLLEDSNSQ